MTKPTLLIGAGGHAKVVASVLLQCNTEIVGFVDPAFQRGDAWYAGITCLGDDDTIETFNTSDVFLANGIGSLPGQSARKRIYCKRQEMGYRFPAIIHPSATLAGDVELGAGVQIMAGVLVQPGARIGENAIINTGAIVDHDCVINDHVHVAPGAVLSGGVRLGTNVHVGTGASIIQGILIGDDAVIGAGATVTRNVDARHIVYPSRSTSKPLS